MIIKNTIMHDKRHRAQPMKGGNNKSKALARFAGVEEQLLSPIDRRLARSKARRNRRLAMR